MLLGSGPPGIGQLDHRIVATLIADEQSLLDQAVDQALGRGFGPGAEPAVFGAAVGADRALDGAGKDAHQPGATHPERQVAHDM